MNRANADTEIQRIFSAYRTLTTADKNLLRTLNDGKLYELYVLSRVVEELDGRGFTLTFSGTTLKFKWSPGRIRPGDPHFVVYAPTGATRRLYVDIEFETLGSGKVPVCDKSLRHEIDIVVVDTISSYPQHNEVLLGVECKAVAKFSKSIVKEVLGVRRELSFFHRPQRSRLSSLATKGVVYVAADPPSEYWLAYVDVAGTGYRESPAAFGIDFKHWQP
jgi:hypothetical protein